jgi:hypothetical protein
MKVTCEEMIEEGMVKRLLNVYGASDTPELRLIEPNSALEWFQGECVGYLKDCLATGRTRKVNEKEIFDKIAGFVEGISTKCNEKQKAELVKSCQKLFAGAIKAMCLGKPLNGTTPAGTVEVPMEMLGCVCNAKQTFEEQR